MTDCANLTECPVIIGTAGHVDHGKSALIEALTGKNPDRLEVERRRGMTVELGFGELALPSGRLVGLVDVPGHAHYLRAMVQGATGIDIAVLVVSAIEGVMPQTREHVHVLELLGVRHMVVALTMADLADDEIIELSELDVADFLSGTVFSEAPVVPVSSLAGSGVDALRAELDGAIDRYLAERAVAPKRPGLAARLPIDRRFSIKGTGTVVTGTLWDAPISVGDELVALPAGVSCRVRSIQVHGDTQRALPGQRTALNLTGDGVSGLPRGTMLCAKGVATQTLRFMARLRYLGREGSKPAVLESGTRVHVMAGTAEVIGRIMLMEGESPVAVGETRTVQVRLEEPLPVRSGDRFIVLSYSPVALVGGGEVLLSRCRRSRELTQGEHALLDALVRHDRAEAVACWTGMQRLPVTVEEASTVLDLSAVEARGLLDTLVRKGSVVALAGSKSDALAFATSASFDAAMGALSSTLKGMHAAAPKQTGFTPGEVARAAWPGSEEEISSLLFAEGCRRGVCALEGSEVFDPHSAAAAARLVGEACERIVGLLDEEGLDAPALPDVGKRLALDRDIMTRALRELSLERRIVKVERDVALSATAENRARELVAAAIEKAGGAAPTSALREALGVSRKRAISILEHFDAVRFTALDKEAGGLRSLR